MFEDLPEFDWRPEENYFGRTIMCKRYTIYSLVNKQNGKRYIGRTTNLKLRMRTHFNSLINGTHHNKELLEDFENGFDCEVLEDGIKYVDSKEKEKFYMLKYKTYDSHFGYNTNDPIFKQKGKITKLRKELI